MIGGRRMASAITFHLSSARSFWAPTTFKKLLGFISTDDRPGEPKGNVFWPGDQGDTGHVLHGYESCQTTQSCPRNDTKSSKWGAVKKRTKTYDSRSAQSGRPQRRRIVPE